MTKNPISTVIQADMAIEGKLITTGALEVRGYVKGDIAAGHLVVHETGTHYGTLMAGSALLRGVCQGKLRIKNLLSISRDGSAIGTLEYGQLAMEQGGTLSADLRNIPPELGGDLNLSVNRGRAVKITERDLTSYDPDDAAKDITYNITNMVHGFIMLTTAPKAPAISFTQADLEQGRVGFTHDNSTASLASFDVIVADDSGATSGKAETVRVAVVGAG